MNNFVITFDDQLSAEAFSVIMEEGREVPLLFLETAKNW